MFIEELQKENLKEADVIGNLNSQILKYSFIDQFLTFSKPKFVYDDQDVFYKNQKFTEALFTLLLFKCWVPQIEKFFLMNSVIES